MKRRSVAGVPLIMILFSLLFYSPIVSAQDNVFLLVDISGNVLNDPNKITLSMRTNAQNMVKALILDNYTSNFNTQWKLSITLVS